MEIQKNLTIIFDTFLFIQVDIEAIKPISQNGNNLFSEAHALSNLKLHTCTSPPQGPLPSQDSTWPSWGWPEHIAGDGKDLLRFRWSSWHWEDHLDELVKKELTLVMLPPFQWWFVGVTFNLVVLAQKTLCNGAIKIVSKVSPLKILQTLDAFFFGTTLFFWMKGMAVDWRERFVHIIIQFFVNIIRITKHSLLNSVPLNEMELNKMTKGLALRP